MKTNNSILFRFNIILFSLPLFAAQASNLTIPNQFANGTRAIASEVNANFNATATSVNDNQQQLTVLLEQVNLLAAKVEALEAENVSLNASLNSLTEKVIPGLSDVLSITTDGQGRPAAIFNAVNLHINSGAGQTQIVNGLGNLIIGYNELSTIAPQLCSDGQYDNQNDCESGNEIWSNIHKSGSHNLIVGAQHNYSRTGGIIAGLANNVTADNSSISGGYQNTASGTRSSISGGFGMIASGESSSVSGGFNNIASGNFSSISGGISNRATGEYSSVSAGFDNTADGESSSVSGGSSNLASGFWSSVSGGNSNKAGAARSSISGGSDNTASGVESSVSGGELNTASGFKSSVSGGANGSAIGENDWVAGTLSEDN